MSSVALSGRYGGDTLAPGLDGFVKAVQLAVAAAGIVLDYHFTLLLVTLHTT